MTIEILFFNLEKNLTDTASIVFESLGMPYNMKGSSAHSLGGEYSSLSIFGLNLKLEPNTYDYENDYNYMLSIYKDKLTELSINEEIILPISKIVARLLTDNIKIDIAHEIDNKLDIYNLDN